MFKEQFQARYAGLVNSPGKKHPSTDDNIFGGVYPHYIPKIKSNAWLQKNEVKP